MSNTVDTSSLVIDVRPGERLVVASVTVELVQKSGQLARLRVTAPRDVKIERKQAVRDAPHVVPSMA